MNIIDQIKVEIERRIKEDYNGPDPDYNEIAQGACASILAFLDTLSKENPSENLEKDKCFGCNNVKGCVTCVDGNQWAHISEIEGEEKLGRRQHTESWVERVKEELQNEEELLEMRLDTLRRIRDKKNQFQQEQLNVDLEKMIEFECIGKKVRMTIQELINYYIDTECANVADECGF